MTCLRCGNGGEINTAGLCWRCVGGVRVGRIAQLSDKPDPGWLSKTFKQAEAAADELPKALGGTGKLKDENARLRAALLSLAEHAAHQARSAATAAARSRDAGLYDEAACDHSAAGAYREMEAAARALLDGKGE